MWIFSSLSLIHILLPQIHIDLRFEAGEQRILLNGEDVSEAIRLPEASAAASAVSALPEVRAYLLEQQRSLARQYNCLLYTSLGSLFSFS